MQRFDQRAFNALKRLKVWGRLGPYSSRVLHFQVSGAFKLFSMRGHLGPYASRIVHFQAEGSFKFSISGFMKKHKNASGASDSEEDK